MDVLLEGLFIENWDIFIVIATLSTIFLAGKWSWHLCSELPKMYDTYLPIQSIVCSKETMRYGGRVWVFSIRRRIFMYVCCKIASNEGDGLSLLLV